ncbi:MAG: 3-dehydroquinate synthase [Oscillospiraceae bacterium]|nr:3-dehydroquinate synthase [Oscillospiraceae bacterium]
MNTIAVNASKSYDVIIESGGCARIGKKVRALFPAAKKIALVTDENVYKHYAPAVANAFNDAGFDGHIIVGAPGEASKNGESYFGLLEKLAKYQLTRADLIVALGGGVVGDLAGFAAATYLRGINFIQIPTTLLAMVDSSVGGKTGINLSAGKNLAGAFWQPSLVLCDPAILKTLPDQIFRDGMAEVIKYGMIRDFEILKKLEYNLTGGDLEAIIAKCIAIKRDIVEKDERDTGERMLLNFGHTVGHALEKLSNYTLSHGFGVGLGMMIDTCAAVKKGHCPPDLPKMLGKLLSRYQLPVAIDYSPQEIYKAALGDKKRAGDSITIVVPTALGKSELLTMPTAELLGWIEGGVAR